MKRGKRILAVILAFASFTAAFFTDPDQAGKVSAAYELNPEQTAYAETDGLAEQMKEKGGTAVRPVKKIEEEQDGGTAEEYLEDFGDIAGTASDSAANLGSEFLQEAAKRTGSMSGLAKSFGVLGSLQGIFTSINDLQNMENRVGPGRAIEEFLIVANLLVSIASFIGVFAAFPPALAFVLPLVSVLISLLLWFIRSNYFKRWLEEDIRNGGKFYKILDTICFWSKCPSNVNVYKPNIYIYSPEETEVTVIFDRPDLLTRTIPDYRGVWKASTGEKGTLYGEDGEDYRFLFYESVADPALFQTDKGFMIRSEEREEQFGKILEAYGFNDSEIQDFTEFWCEKLDQTCDYMMYPQGTETVDLAMPLQIIPEPESVERMWFAFEKCGEQGEESIRTEQLTPFGRGEYAVVEWGGLILNE